MYWASQEVGEPIPNNTDHAVSVTLPTWEDVVGYEEGDSNIVSRMKTGYPRFFIHRSIKALKDYLIEEYGRKELEDLLVFPSYKVAKRCQAYMVGRIALLENVQVKIRVVQLVTMAPKKQSEESFRIALTLGLVFFPKQYFKYCKEFWQHSGEGISSRLAEYALLEFRYEKSLKLHQLSLREAKEDKDFVEMKFGRNLDFSEAKKAGSLIRQRIIGEVNSNNPGLNASPDDVYLYPSGMSSIYNSHNMMLSLLGEHKSVVYGFPYVDTLNIMKKFGPGLIHLGHSSEAELDELENSLELGSKILALFCESPSNPLLKTPNLARIRQIADKHHFPVIIDETVGNSINTNIYKYADILCCSLTKIFSGDSNVLSGCFVLNQHSRFYDQFKKWLSDNYECNFWKEDMLYLERNSRDFVKRNSVTNNNAAEVLKLFKRYQDKGIIKEVFYPSIGDTADNYEVIRTPNGGYGGLISVVFATHEISRKFFNKLQLSKGPSLGTNFTLICPYTVLVHYFELVEVSQYGIHPDLIRLSVGIEKTEELLSVVEAAILEAMK